MMDTETPAKPLHVLVYTGESCNDGLCYNSIVSSLQVYIHFDKYLVYLLSPDQLHKDPWTENLKLLILSCETLDGKAATAFRNYVSGGGDILIFASNLDLPEFGLTVKLEHNNYMVNPQYKGHPETFLMKGRPLYTCTQERVVLAEDACGERILKFVGSGPSVVITSEIHLELDPTAIDCTRSEFSALVEVNSIRLEWFKDLLIEEFGLLWSTQPIPALTPCYLLSHNLPLEILKEIGSVETHLTKLNLLPTHVAIEMPSLEELKLPIVYSLLDHDFYVPFKKEIYLANLKTRTLGRNLVFVEVASSTMDIIYNLSEIEGACVVGWQQTAGRGRGTNKWISPVGSANFSINIKVSLSTHLGERLSFIQHFLALSAIHAIRNMPGYESLDIRVKWPNDIYFGSRIKIGGVLVGSLIQGQDAVVFGGIGVSVGNKLPTLCINDIISRHNSLTGSSLELFSTELFIARCLNVLEKMIDEFQRDGPDSMLKLYYKYWLHDRQEVTIGGSGEKVTIVGLNDYGYLVAERESGDTMTLQPDGNSFDMMKNLITLK